RTCGACRSQPNNVWPQRDLGEPVFRLLCGGRILNTRLRREVRLRYPRDDRCEESLESCEGNQKGNDHLRVDFQWKCNEECELQDLQLLVNLDISVSNSLLFLDGVNECLIGGHAFRTIWRVPWIRNPNATLYFVVVAYTVFQKIDPS